MVWRSARLVAWRGRHPAKHMIKSTFVDVMSKSKLPALVAIFSSTLRSTGLFLFCDIKAMLLFVARVILIDLDITPWLGISSRLTFYEMMSFVWLLLHITNNEFYFMQLIHSMTLNHVTLLLFILFCYLFFFCHNMTTILPPCIVVLYSRVLIIHTWKYSYMRLYTRFLIVERTDNHARTNERKLLVLLCW